MTGKNKSAAIQVLKWFGEWANTMVYMAGVITIFDYTTSRWPIGDWLISRWPTGTWVAIGAIFASVLFSFFWTNFFKPLIEELRRP